MDAIVVAALEALRLALAKCQGRRPSFLQLLYPDGTIEQYGLCEGSMAEDRASAPDGRTAPELTPREKAAIDVLARADQPLKGRTVASRARLRYTSHFREMMAELVIRELVIVGPEGGYWLKGRPLPQATDREGR
jgi:hypothetical protein